MISYSLEIHNRRLIFGQVYRTIVWHFMFRFCAYCLKTSVPLILFEILIQADL